jgi:hypothetical protein
MTDGMMDIGTSVANSIGRYFSIVSFIPSSLYVLFVYLLTASGSWHHQPDWGHAFTSLGHLGVGGIALLAFASVGLGLFIHPIQFAIVQFFEGYWGTSPVSQVIRHQRIIRYQRKCEALNRDTDSVMDMFAAWKAANSRTTLSIRAPHRSKSEEAERARGNFPANLDEVMPTRLGNVLRRAESQAGRQYQLNSLQVVPHLLLVAPANHVDYVNDQRSQLDLAVRMTFVSIVATVTTIIFLWPYGAWVLIALIPYALAYLSYRGSVVAAGHYGNALETLVNLNRFTLYQQLHLQLPASADAERTRNQELARLLTGNVRAKVDYEHPGNETKPAENHDENRNGGQG